MTSPIDNSCPANLAPYTPADPSDPFPAEIARSYTPACSDETALPAEWGTNDLKPYSPLSSAPLLKTTMSTVLSRYRVTSVLDAGLAYMDNVYYSPTPGRPELGTWCEGMNSGPWDTAMSLITELKTGVADFDSTAKMVRYLLSVRRSDGGWADSPGDVKSATSATVICFAALTLFQTAYLSKIIESKDSVLLTALNGAIVLAHGFVQKRGFADMDAAAMKSNFVCLLYYAQVFPQSTAIVDEAWAFLETKGIDAHHLPEPDALAEMCRENGVYQVFPEVLTCLIVLLAPQDVRDTPLYERYCDKLFEYQDENGMWCDVTSISNLCLIALHQAGYSDGSPDVDVSSAMSRGFRAVRELRREGTNGIQSYTYDSSTWNNCLYIDTRLRLDPAAVMEPRILAGIEYLLACQEPDGGFQYVLGATGDGECDTTGFILALLKRVKDVLDVTPILLPAERSDLPQKISRALHRGYLKLVSMQNDNGGFSTFARTDLDKPPGAMEFTPGSSFVTPANSTTITDQSVADITAHALMGLAATGQTVQNSDIVRKAVNWLRKDFVAGAGWWGRWGCGYLYGTCEVLRALKAVGVDMANDPLAESAIKLLLSKQNADGGWGENGHFSDNPNLDPTLHAMHGTSNASFTALTLMTLLDLGFKPDHPAVDKATRYLLDRFKFPQSLFGENGSVLAKPEDTSTDEDARDNKAYVSQTLSLTQQEAVLWQDATPNADFYPTVWYQKELTFGDLVPLAALARYLQAS